MPDMLIETAADPDYIVACPNCKAPKGASCVTPRGKFQATTHGWRRGMAHHQREAEKTGCLVVACTHCKAPVGVACTGAVAGGASHVKREKHAAQHQRATEEMNVARAKRITRPPETQGAVDLPPEETVDELMAAAGPTSATVEDEIARTDAVNREVLAKEPAPARRKHAASEAVDLHAPRSTRCPTCSKGTVSGFEIICSNCASRR